MREERKKIAEQYRRYMEMEKTMVNTSYITSDGLLIEQEGTVIVIEKEQEDLL